MKIIIGIFQDKEDMTTFYKKRMLDVSSLTQVGPFFSRSQALSWMRELHEQLGDSEISFIPATNYERLQWYGFTFEE